MRVLETFTCSCYAGGTAPVKGCPVCRGSGRAPIGSGHLWADGKWRDEKPPSDETIEVRAFERTSDGAVVPTPGRPERPPVPKDFMWTDRATLRRVALEAVLKAGGLLGARLRIGAELLAEAEEIERWIAEPDREISKEKD